MHNKLKRRLVIVAAAVAAVAFAGGAYAATQASGPSTRQAFLNDVAKRLNVTPQQLNGALKGAFLDQLNAAVKAGKLTQAQANAIEQRLERSGGTPPWLAPRGLLGGPRFGPGGPGRGGPLFGLRFRAESGALAAAAKYLNMSNSQLLDQLRSGKSLAQIANSRGKSAAGLEQAITASLRSNLDRAVANKRITKAQEQRVLSRLSELLGRLVNRRLPAFGQMRLPPRGPGFPRPSFIPGATPPGGPPAAQPGGPATQVLAPGTGSKT